MAVQMNDAEEALAQLAAQAPQQTMTRAQKEVLQRKAEEALLAAQAPLKGMPRPPLKFAFAEIGEQIAASLIKAADEQVEAAHKLRENVMELAENIGAELEKHAKRMLAMDMRTKEFGLAVLDAHKKFLNGGEHDNQIP